MNAHHYAEYNGKRIAIDYVHPTREFRIACQRIIDNGANGFVDCPDGRRFEVKQSCRTAKLVRDLAVACPI